MKSLHESKSSLNAQPVTDKSVKVLANAIYRQLQDEGYDARNIISVSSQLIDLVTSALQQNDGSVSRRM